MFTGIIIEVGKIRSVQKGNDTICEIESALKLKKGDSVSVDGVCLTVIQKKKDSFVVEISGDTRKRTTLNKIRVGTEVNLEPPLKVGDYLSGHLVTGHVDTVTKIKRRLIKAKDHIYYFEIPKKGREYIIPLGSVAIDGISLTVKEVTERDFSVVIIPQTLKVTTIGKKKVGSPVNIEYDIIIRYIKRWNSTS
ncbi:MAG TPA: riboflavin synthase [bacterium (Candidatus Stahlbacteria)]|nr:riboflavin synthase [Candidatus Stahlbacteria bacterium]